MLLATMRPLTRSRLLSRAHHSESCCGKSGGYVRCWPSPSGQSWPALGVRGATTISVPPRCCDSAVACSQGRDMTRNRRFVSTTSVHRRKYISGTRIAHHRDGAGWPLPCMPAVASPAVHASSCLIWRPASAGNPRTAVRPPIEHPDSLPYRQPLQVPSIAHAYLHCD
jgi:hypothetical protein